jgi:hypothetical protein
VIRKLFFFFFRPGEQKKLFLGKGKERVEADLK